MLEEEEPPQSTSSKQEEASAKKQKVNRIDHEHNFHSIASSLPPLSRSIIDTNDLLHGACTRRPYLSFHCGEFAPLPSLLQKWRPTTKHQKIERWCHHALIPSMQSQYAVYPADSNRFRESIDGRSGGIWCLRSSPCIVPSMADLHIAAKIRVGGCCIAISTCNNTQNKTPRWYNNQIGWRENRLVGYAIQINGWIDVIGGVGG